MADIRKDIVLLLTRELGAFERELELFPDEAMIWKTLPGATNSAGNLAHHLAGNLQHFVGALLGKNGYVRNRDLEFSRRSGSRADAIADLRAAARAVDATVSRLTDADLDAPFPQAVGGTHIRTSLFLLHLCAHAAFHLGQAGYLRRILTGDTRTSDAVALKPLAS